MPLISRIKEGQHDLAPNATLPATEPGLSQNVADVSTIAGEIGETRLTPQEAAATIASLERERLAREQHAAGTISINEVIEQFGLNATPEEVLVALSENRRLQQQQTTTTQKIQIQRKLYWDSGRLVRIALTVTTVFIAFLLLAWTRLQAELSAAKAGEAAFAAAKAAAMQAEAPQPAPPAPPPAPPKPFASLVDSLVVIDKSSGHPVSRLMSEVPDGRAVQVQADTLENTLALHQTDGYSEGTRSGWWTATKRHQRLFLKGFLPISVSPGVAALGNLVVTNHSHRPNTMTIGPNPMQVWVPADRIHSIDSFYGTDAGIKEGDDTSGTFASGDDDWSRIVLDGLKPGDLQYDGPSAKAQTSH